MLTKPQANEHSPYFSRYIDLVPDGDLMRTLEEQHRVTQKMLAPLSAEKAKYRYADGKWSVTEVVGHLADTERIFAYRALRFARGDTTPLPGYNEVAYTPAGQFDARSLGDVLGEFTAVRGATIALLRGLPDDSFTRSGHADGKPCSVRALAYIIAGHELHHVNLFQTRYGIGNGG
jgi:hypothetical protein